MMGEGCRAVGDLLKVRGKFLPKFLSVFLAREFLADGGGGGSGGVEKVFGGGPAVESVVVVVRFVVSVGERDGLVRSGGVLVVPVVASGGKPVGRTSAVGRGPSECCKRTVRRIGVGVGDVLEAVVTIGPVVLDGGHPGGEPGGVEGPR